MTIHKSQGQTLDKIVVNLGKSERYAGKTFVALSRVKELGHIMFDTTFDFSRLDKIKKCKNLGPRLNEERRLKRLAAETTKRFPVK